jgi:spermidine synthase
METPATDSSRGRRLIPLAIVALGVSAVIAQLALMREMLSAFAGNEMVLGIILGNWLLLTGVGAWIGRAGGKLKEPVGALIAALVLVAVLPPVQVFLLRAVRDAVFPRGAIVGVAETVVGSFVLLSPYCIVSGCLLTLACALLAQREGPAGIGRVYVADSIGSILGGALFTFVLVRLFDHLGILYVPACVSLLAAAAVAFRFRRRAALGVTMALMAVTLAAALLLDADTISTALQYPQQKLLFRASSPYGRLVVTESSGQFNFIENGLPFTSTRNVEQVEATAHYAMSQRPDARQVLLVGGGVSGSAKEILKYGVSEVTYVELDPLIIEAGRRFLPANLDGPRIRVVATDGRLFIKQTDRHFDVVIVDVPDPSTSQLNRFYTAEFFAEVKRVLSKDGVLSFTLGRYENYVSQQLAQMLASAHRTLRRSFANALAVPAGRVFFLASDGALHADIAARIEQARVPTLCVKRSYLDAMLTPDRMADIQRAVSQPAAVNEDFSPVLYYYHLRYWMSQFRGSFGVLEAALILMLVLYLLRMRAVPLVIFVSGFAASALQVVLLLAFQILYGSLYQQLGVIVTMFMAGLAVGAFAAPRISLLRQKRALAWLAFAIAGFAALLPLALSLLNRMGGGVTSLLAVQFAIPALTFALAALVGMEFPIASHAQFDGGAATASRLYTADFVGAFLGALLPSTFLIPVLGVATVCLLTAGLNVIGGVAVLFRKT